MIGVGGGNIYFKNARLWLLNNLPGLILHRVVECYLGSWEAGAGILLCLGVFLLINNNCCEWFLFIFWKANFAWDGVSAPKKSQYQQ